MRAPFPPRRRTQSHTFHCCECIGAFWLVLAASVSAQLQLRQEPRTIVSNGGQKKRKRGKDINRTPCWAHHGSHRCRKSLSCTTHPTVISKPWREVGAQVDIKRVPELVPEEIAR